ncbi:MAG: nuclear transport factor 2 family protein [Candidatus Tumulicola sp.]
MKSTPVRTAIWLLLIVFYCSSAVSGNDSYSRADAERYIKASEAAWAESVSTNDASVLKRILASDFVWVLDGEVWNKARSIADAEAGPGDFLSDHLNYAHVRFFGDTAVVQGSETWTRKGGRKGRFVWTDTWIRRNGQWQIVAAEDITVPIKNAR